MSRSIWNCLRFVQTPVLHFLSSICSLYSSANAFNVLITGFGALFPSPHNAVLSIISASSRNSSISVGFPFPATILSRISSILFVPSLHGTHFPQDSLCVNPIKNFATSTMQVFSSITTRPPEPIIALNFLTESKSSGSSKCFSTRHPPDGPPI